MLFLLVLGLTTFVVFIKLIVLITKSISRKSDNSLSIPPGRAGWPLLGETLDYVTNPEKFVHDRMIKHSPDVFTTSFAGEKMAILCGPSGNKFFFSNDVNLFSPWLPPFLADLLFFQQSNDDHRSQSSKLVKEHVHKSLRLEFVKRYVSIMETNAQEHLETFWAPHDQVKVQALTKQFTFAQACCLLIDCNQPEQVRELAEPFFVLTQGILSLPLKIPGTTYYRAIKAAEAVREKLIHIISKKKEELLVQKDNDDVQGVFDRVLKTLLQDGEYIDEVCIASEIVGLLFAAYHTTSNALTFVISHLADHPHIYEMVLQEQLEISQSKETGEPLTWKDIQKMKYLWNVVSESMRLTPPGLGGYREVAADFTCAGFKIPKGWKVNWLVHSTYKDPKYFPDPEKFDPSRFEGNNVPPFTFVPFGGGPRMCCGKEFARIEILVFLHKLVTKFRFKKVNPNEKIIYRGDPVPAEGIHIRLETHEK